MKTLRIFLDPTPTAVPLETVAENAQRPPIENINKSIKVRQMLTAYLFTNKLFS